MMFELLQNGLDAVEHNVGEKRVAITIDPAANQVTVSDNGVGFPQSSGIFALGKGTKGDVTDYTIRGEHGVGMKMAILCSELFEVWARTTEGKTWKATFTNGWRFLENLEQETFEADAKDAIIPAEYTTTVRVKFPRGVEGLLRPIDIREILVNILSPYVSVSPHSVLAKRVRCELFVEHYFRTSSYTGDVNRLFDDVVPAKLHVAIAKDVALTEDELSERYPEFLRQFWENPRTIIFPAKYWDPTEWYPDPERKGFRTKGQLQTFNPNVNTPDQLWVLKLKTPTEFRILLQNPHITEKYPAGTFDDLIDNHIRGIFIIVGSAARTAKYNINQVMITHPDQIIAADGVITTNQIRAPKRGKNQNYLNNIHFLINIADRVNYGKQGVKNPYLLSQLYNFFEEIYVKKLVDLASSVAGRSAATGGPPPPPVLDIIGLDELDEPELSIRRIPKLENTLIALVHELIAKGRIQGLVSYQLSSLDKYDCQGLIKIRDEELPNPTRDSDLANIEYRVRLWTS